MRNHDDAVCCKEEKKIKRCMRVPVLRDLWAYSGKWKTVVIFCSFSVIVCYSVKKLELQIIYGYAVNENWAAYFGNNDTLCKQHIHLNIDW